MHGGVFLWIQLKFEVIGMEIVLQTSHLCEDGGQNLIQAFHTAVAAMHDSAMRFGVAANNIANTNTPGYVPQRGVPSSDQGNIAQIAASPTANSSFASTAALVGMPGVHLPGAFVDLKTAEASYKASLTVLTAAQEMSRVLVNQSR